MDPATDPTAFRNVEIRFDGGANTGMAYRYIRASGIYQYTDYRPVPWTIWDVDNNIQLSGGFLETGTTSVNGIWQPSTSGIGDREAIFVFAHPYTATADPFYEDPARDDLLAEGGDIDFMYFVWPIATNDPMTIDNGDKYVLSLAKRSETDFFTFSTTPPNPMNVSLAQSELARIRAVPNPYLAHSTYELHARRRADPHAGEERREHVAAQLGYRDLLGATGGERDLHLPRGRTRDRDPRRQAGHLHGEGAAEHVLAAPDGPRRCLFEGSVKP
jgi:hypothetical protein